MQAEGEAEQHRQISPWQSLLGEPDWKRVDALGELGVAQLLEGRPGEAATSVSLDDRVEVGAQCGGVDCWCALLLVEGWAGLVAKRCLRCADCTRVLSMRRVWREPCCPARTLPTAWQDLRTRALSITLGSYEEMYDAQFLSPPTFNRLKVRSGGGQQWLALCLPK